MPPHKRARAAVVAPKPLPETFDEIVLQKAGFDIVDPVSLLQATAQFKSNAMFSDKDILKVQQSMCKLGPMLMNEEVEKVFLETVLMLFIGTAPRDRVLDLYRDAVRAASEKNAKIIGAKYKTLLAECWRDDARATQMLPAMNEALNASKAVERLLENCFFSDMTDLVWLKISMLCKEAQAAVNKCNEIEDDFLFILPNYDDIASIPTGRVVKSADFHVSSLDIITARIGQFVQTVDTGAAAAQ